MPSNKITTIIDAKFAGRGEFDKATKQVANMEKQMKSSSKSAQAMGTDFKTLATQVAGFGLAVGALKVGKDLIKIASAAEEIQAKFDTVFKEAKNDANDWAESFAESVGRADQDIKEFTGSLGDILKPLGFATEQSLDMSEAMVQLALDVASFNNRQDADVIRAFTAALTGERESLKTLGIVISEADVQQEAYRAGLIEVGAELTKTAKATATMNLLFANTADAQGDLIRTSDSFANQLKRLQGNVKQLQQEMGSELLPVAGEFLGKLNEMVSFLRENSWEVVKFGKIAFEVFGSVAVALGNTVGKSFIGIISLINAADAALVKFTGALGGMDKGGLGIGGTLAAGLNTAVASVETLGDAIGGFGSGVIQTFQTGSIEGFSTEMEITAENAKKRFGDLGMEIYLATEEGKQYADAVEEMEKKNKGAEGSVDELSKAMSEQEARIKKINEETAAMTAGLPGLSSGTGAAKKAEEEARLLVRNMKSVYGTDVKLAQGTAEKILGAKKKLAENGIDLKIADSFRSAAIQSAAFESGKEGVAAPGTSLHETGQAIDLSQLEEDNQNREEVFQALREFGLKQNPEEWWHWDEGTRKIGEAITVVKETFVEGADGMTASQIKLQDSLNSTTGNFEKLRQDGIQAIVDLEAEHNKRMEEMDDSARKLQYSLLELTQAYEQTVAGFDRSTAERVIQQEELIASLKEQLSSTKERGDSEDISDIQNRLAEEISALQSFSDESEGFQAELAEARRRASLTDFERFVEDMEARRAEALQEFEEKKLQIENEIAALEAQRAREQEIFEKKKKAIEKINAEIKLNWSSTLGGMEDRTTQFVEYVKSKLEDLKSALAAINALTAGETGVSDLNAASPYLGEGGTELFASPEALASFNQDISINISLDGLQLTNIDTIEQLMDELTENIARSAESVGKGFSPTPNI